LDSARIAVARFVEVARVLDANVVRTDLRRRRTPTNLRQSPVLARRFVAAVARVRSRARRARASRSRHRDVTRARAIKISRSSSRASARRRAVARASRAVARRRAPSRRVETHVRGVACARIVSDVACVRKCGVARAFGDAGT